MRFAAAAAAAARKFDDPRWRADRGEEDPTMLAHLGMLKAINEAGYITTQSQGGTQKRGRGSVDNERAFVQGFMRTESAKDFLVRMAFTDKAAVYVPRVAEDAPLPAALDLPVTVTTHDGTASVTTHISPALPGRVHDTFLREVHLAPRGVVCVQCWDTKWNRDASGTDGLFTAVLDALRRA